MAKYSETDDKWFIPQYRGFRWMCCDCSLVHTIDFRLNKNRQIEIRIVRQEKATAAARRRRTKKVLIVE